MVRSRSSLLALPVAALVVALVALAALVALVVLVALLAPGPSPARAQGKTYIIKRGGSKWTKFGREHYHRKRYGGRKLRLVQLKGGDGYVVGKPDRAWGTRLAVYRISWVMALYRRRFPKACFTRSRNRGVSSPLRPTTEIKIRFSNSITCFISLRR